MRRTIFDFRCTEVVFSRLLLRILLFYILYIAFQVDLSVYAKTFEGFAAVYDCKYYLPLCSFFSRSRSSESVFTF
jgi:hypothetical protein